MICPYCQSSNTREEFIKDDYRWRCRDCGDSFEGYEVVGETNDMSDFKTRLLNDLTELTIKCSKLREFVGSQEFKALDGLDSLLLTIQLNTMRAYEGILVMRAGRLCRAGELKEWERLKRELGDL